MGYAAGAPMTADAQQPEQIVYSKTINVPAKAFPHIVKRKLALNDIGEGDDGFTRIDFELQDGDVIQVVRGSHPHTPAPEREDTIGALISENARIGSELKRMTEKAERLSGEHDAAIEHKATLAENKRVLDAVIEISTDVSFAHLGDRRVFNERIESLRTEGDEQG
jgi:hypothetical protein